METIGGRAAAAIRERAKQNGTSVQRECEKINVSRKVFSSWNTQHRTPHAYFLQQMVFAGYDVIYILSGVKNDA